MKSLIELLTEQTQILKEEYLKRTEIYAIKQFAWAEKVSKWKHEQWVKAYPQDSQIGDVLSWEGKKTREKSYSIVTIGKEKYLAKQKKSADQHYTNSIIKLVARIEKKGLNKNKLKVKTATIGQNIETIISDEIMSVKAWTIIAGGPIQQPHFRYLVK